MAGRTWRVVADWLVRRLWPLAVAVLPGLMLLLLHREIRDFHYRDIREAVRAIPASRTVERAGGHRVHSDFDALVDLVASTIPAPAP